MIKTLLAVAGATAIFAETLAATPSSLKLYALDCGTIEMFDIGAFDASGRWAGQTATLADPCILVRHPKGDFLWDTGLREATADLPDGNRQPWGHLRLKQSLTSQLASIGLKPGDIDYLALSHYHDDHAGNANMFADSTFIAQRIEHAFMFADTTKANPAVFAPFANLETAETILFDTKHDVFGDETVTIHAAPGHTPGHSVLLVKLPKTGALLFSGDLYILAKSRTDRAIPGFNHDKAATRKSQEMFEELAEKTQARVVIQHDMSHFHALPNFPAYLE